MNLLKDSSRVIQIDAFQLFKAFAANPEKPLKIQRILYKNKEKIISLLLSLPALKPKDARFGQEVKTVIRKLNELPAPPPAEGRVVRRRRSQTEVTVPMQSRPYIDPFVSPQVMRIIGDTADDIEIGDSSDESDSSEDTWSPRKR